MTRLESTSSRRFSASRRFCSAVSPSVHARLSVQARLAALRVVFQKHKFMGSNSVYSRTCCGCLLICCLVGGLSGRHVDRPIHPLRLDGFPGAPVEEGLFPLRPGMTWTFRDRLNPDAPPLLLKLIKERRRFYLEGSKAGERVEIGYADGFLEVKQGDVVVDRPLKYPGKAGETWVVNQALVTIFGYDWLDVLGERKRALVVAVDRRHYRDLAWFVQGMGWVRLRTERRGHAVRDAVLVAFEPGGMN